MKYGEIIKLGRHKILCGDATNRDDVMRLIDGTKIDLILTDPPYGIKIQHNTGSVGSSNKSERSSAWFNANIYPQLIGDNNTNTARNNYEIVKDFTDKKIIWGGNYFTDFLPVSGAWLFWDKKRRNMDFGDGELAWRSWGNAVKYYEQTWNGVCMAGSYFLNARKNRARVHPTQKPVELHMKILEDFSKENDIVLDCFGGSGTTLIACELTNRTCYMMEISPDYCDVIKTRYEEVSERYSLFKEKNNE